MLSDQDRENLCRDFADRRAYLRCEENPFTETHRDTAVKILDGFEPLILAVVISETEPHPDRLELCSFLGYFRRLLRSEEPFDMDDREGLAVLFEFLEGLILDVELA